MRGVTMLLLILALTTAALGRQLLDTPSFDDLDVQDLDQRSEDDLEDAYQPVEKKQVNAIVTGATIVFKIIRKKKSRSISSDISEEENVAAAINRQTLDTSIVCDSGAKSSGEKVLGRMME